MTSLLCLFSITACGGGGDEALQYDCSVFPTAQSSPYVLPWLAGQTYTAHPHAARVTGQEQYAIDVLMPIGTEVVASRSGVVAYVEESFVDGDNANGHANFVIVRHDDGTYAGYWHLTQMGALVQVGDTVQQGDVIARSGNTGISAEPHLHFYAVDAVCTTITGCQTVPVNFRNAQAASGSSALSCGLQDGASYTALPF
jgi:murein DD-endopeptidase MepM/ murein hydrolase activator NlpD